MKTAIRWSALTTLAIHLGGCAIVTSHAPDPSVSPSGMIYHLPKAVLPVELVAKGGVLELRMQSSKQVADPTQRYLLQHPTNAFASDNVKVDWDSSGLLLSKLTVDSTDQTLAILKEVAKATAIGRAEAAAPASEVILAAGDFDPDLGPFQGSNLVLMNDLHNALGRQLAQWNNQCTDKTLKPEEKPASENCSMANDLLPRLGREPILKITATAVGTPATGLKADCSIGLCYRSQQPFDLGLEVSGYFSRRTVMMLPNQSPAIALPIDRAPFVKTEHTVEFHGNGMPKSVETKRPSSALQAVSWPLDVYKAVLSATSELITLRIGAKDNDVKLAQKDLDTIKELKRIADEKAAFDKANGKPEAAGDVGSTSAVLSIVMGRAMPAPLLPDHPSPEIPAPRAQCRPGEPCAGNLVRGNR